MTSSTLPDWLVTLHALGEEQMVIVPGGGVFADQVRQSQQMLHFDDLTAHHMAILAMEQYGLMLAGLQPGLGVARTEGEIRSALNGNHTVIWLPSAMLLDNASIEASWDMTSDSIALWLAILLDVDHFLLVKSGNLDVDEQKIVDSCFSQMKQGYTGTTHLLFEQQPGEFYTLVNQLRAGTGSTYSAASETGQ